MEKVKTGSLNSRIASNRKYSFAGRLALAMAAWALVCVSAKAAPVPSRWMSADGSPRGAHAVPPCLEPFAIEAIRAAPAAQGRAAADKGRIAIVVARDIYDGISARLARHVSSNSAIIRWDFGLDWQGSTAVPGDFDGDLAADCAVYDPAAGSWYIYSLANDRKITWPTIWGGSGAIAPGGRP